MTLRSSKKLTWRGHSSLRRRDSSRRSALFIALMTLFLNTAAQAQTTFASITGTITDASGAIVPNAAVTARNVATNIESKTTSNEAGNYTVAQLVPGSYSVIASAPGFKEFVAQDVALVSRDVRRIDVKLEVGTVGTRVEVTGGATLIETDTARLNDSKLGERLVTIPQFNRSIYPLIALNPGVLTAGFGRSTVRFAGSTANQSNWSMDGISFSNPVDATQMGTVAVYLEWVGEMKIDYANNSADVGPIGQITFITRSGTNRLHGAVFDYYDTHGFRARSPFAATSALGVKHQPGFRVEGPVYIPKIYNGKNRTFFSVDVERMRGSAVSTFFTGTVPTDGMRRGNFAGVGAIRDPSNLQPFVGDQIPASRMSPLASRIQQDFFPLPTFGNVNVFATNNYRAEATAPLGLMAYNVFRIDHRFSDKTSVFGRYTRRDQATPYVFEALPSLGQSLFQRDNRAMVLSLTNMFKSTLISETRWGKANDYNIAVGQYNGSEFVKSYGITGLASDLPTDIPGMTAFAIQGMTTISRRLTTDAGVPNNITANFQQYLSWFRGRHTVKVGYAAGHGSLNRYAPNAALWGSLSFTNRFTGSPYADFLLGVPTTASVAPAPIRVEAKRWEHDWFIMDDFKVSSKLTLNLGVRYELRPGWKESNNRLALFDPGSGKVVVPDGGMSVVSPLFPKNYVGIVEAGSVGLPGSTLLRTDKNNIAPRFGLAYRPWGDKTVFRAGWGVFYNVAPQIPQFGDVSPFVIFQTPYTNPLTNPDVILPRVFPSAGSAGPSSVALPTALNPGLRMPYTMQYNFTIQHQRWDTGCRASYIGSGSRQYLWSYDINSPAPGTALYINKPRPFPQYPGIAYQTNGASARYDSLQLEAKRQMSGGLLFQTSWVWARGIYDLDGNYGAVSENPFDRRREKSVSPDIPTHRFTTNLMYQLPFGRGKPLFGNASKAANMIVGGWETSITYSYFGGNFLTPLWTGSDPTGTTFTASSTPAFVTIRPDHLRDGNLPSGQRILTRWFDPSAFAAPAPGRFGTSAKAVIKGPHVNVWHAGIYKSVLLDEKHGIRLRFELIAQNALNHPNYSDPASMNISQSNVGVISAVGGVNGGSSGDQAGPRMLRAAIRFEW